MNRIMRIITVLGATAFVMAASGCLVVSGNSTYETGTAITQSTLQRIEVGQTTEQWILATLGQPSDRIKIEGQPDMQILKYQHTIHESSGGTVLFLFAGHEDKTRKSVVFIEITDGIVSDYWTEK